MRAKSSTDEFWNKRQFEEKDVAKVNISDTVQRDHELQFIFKHVPLGAKMIEIGCGNGFVSQQLRERVGHLDAFDFAENMVESARKTYGETNNRFFHTSVLDPVGIDADAYDVALCVRVLINLRNLDEQKLAVTNMAKMLRHGGKLILIEGFKEGFDEINKLRVRSGIGEAQPAAINFYSNLSDLLPSVLQHFSIEETWNTGVFDFLTRVVLPHLVGAEAAQGPGEFHRQIEGLLKVYDGRQLSNFARLHGFVLTKR